MHAREERGPIVAISAPDVITRYFAAQSARDFDTLLTLFADDATVIDEGQTRRGANEIRAWRENVASVYQYSTELTSLEAVDEGMYIARVHLEGNFPGGTVDLRSGCEGAAAERVQQNEKVKKAYLGIAKPRMRACILERDTLMASRRSDERTAAPDTVESSRTRAQLACARLGSLPRHPASIGQLHGRRACTLAAAGRTRDRPPGGAPGPGGGFGSVGRRRRAGPCLRR